MRQRANQIEHPPQARFSFHRWVADAELPVLIEAKKEFKRMKTP